MSDPIVQDILTESDIVLARGHGKEMARQLGFGMVDQTRIATAISELARNILQYATRGTVSIRVIVDDDRQGLEIVADDQGPGIQDLPSLVAGTRSPSHRGLGLGLSGTRNLMDEFELISQPREGTRVRCVKWL